MLLSLHQSRAVEMFLMVRAVESWDPVKHPRIPKGMPHGGQFLTLDERMQVAVHSAKPGGGKHPLEGFSRVSLMKAAKDRGIYVRRGASEDELRSSLEKDIKSKGVSDKAKELAGALDELGDKPMPSAKGAKKTAQKAEKPLPSSQTAADARLERAQKRLNQLDDEFTARKERGLEPTAEQHAALAEAQREHRAAYRSAHPDAYVAERDRHGKPALVARSEKAHQAPTTDQIAAGHKAASAKKAAPKAAPVTPEGKPDLEKMTVPQLRAFAKANDVPTTGARTKQHLLDAIKHDELRGGVHKMPEGSGAPKIAPHEMPFAWRNDEHMSAGPTAAFKLSPAEQRRAMQTLAKELDQPDPFAKTATKQAPKTPKPDHAKVSADFAEAVKRPMPSDRDRFKQQLGALTGAQLADVAVAHGVKLPAGTKQKKADHLVEQLLGRPGPKA